MHPRSCKLKPILPNSEINHRQVLILVIFGEINDGEFAIVPCEACPGHYHAATALGEKGEKLLRGQTRSDDRVELVKIEPPRVNALFFAHDWKSAIAMTVCRNYCRSM